MSKFHYSGYWRSWSRVLYEGAAIVELNLTPIPCCYGSTWERDVACEKIRVHHTARSKGDIETDQLPKEVFQQIVDKVGVELATKLTSHNYMAEVSFEDIKAANQKSNGGGVPLSAIIEIREGKRATWINQ